MKNITLILAMLIGCVCFGQKKDTLPVTKENGFTITGVLDTTTGSGNLLIGFSNSITLAPTPKQDTVKVMMLVCDTFPISKYFTFSESEVPLGNWIEFPDKEYRRNYVWWQFGYEVRTPCGHSLRDGFITGCTHIEVRSYLDQNKKPLHKSIVVWITKEIN